MRIYIAGPMRGYPKHNFPSFDAARDRFITAGWEVVSPADMDRNERGLSENTPDEDIDDAMIRQIFADDTHAVCFCDAIAVLPGWRKSKGASVEVMLALLLGLRTFDAFTMEEVEISSHVQFDMYTLAGEEIE